MDITNLDRLQEARDVVQNLILNLEHDFIPRLKHPGPVFLSGHGLYPNWTEDPSLSPIWQSFVDIMPAIDGYLSTVEIAKKSMSRLNTCFTAAKRLFLKRTFSKKSTIN